MGPGGGGEEKEKFMSFENFKKRNKICV